MTNPELNIEALDFEPTADDPIVPGSANGAESSILDKVSRPSESKWQKFFVGSPQGVKRQRKVKDETPVPPMPARGKLAAGLQDIYVTIGMMLMAVDPVCAQAIINSAPECAKSMEKLAKTNPAVRRVLLKMLETSAYGAVVAAHLPILMAVVMHHMPALQQVNIPPVQYPQSDPTVANGYGGPGEGGSDVE